MTTGRINQIASSLRPDTIKNMTMLRFKEIHSSPLSFAIHSQPNSIDFSSSQLSSYFIQQCSSAPEEFSYVTEPPLVYPLDVILLTDQPHEPPCQDKEKQTGAWNTQVSRN